jgi:hypothetical protein
MFDSINLENQKIAEKHFVSNFQQKIEKVERKQSAKSNVLIIQINILSESFEIIVKDLLKL